jgi:hypothetical protein
MSWFSRVPRAKTQKKNTYIHRTSPMTEQILEEVKKLNPTLEKKSKKIDKKKS